LGGANTPQIAASSKADSCPDITFDTYEVVIGPAKLQTVLTGFFLEGPMAEIAVIDVLNDGDRRLRMYEFDDGKWTSNIETTLGRKVSHVDVANIGGRDRLISYTPGQLNWFDPETKTEHALVNVNTDFNPGRPNEIPHVDFTHDLNNDGRDDLAIPNKEGFRLFIQNSDGTFADAIQIGPSTNFNRITGADGYRYDPWSQSRVHKIDYNHDGRIDLAYWNVDHFEVHEQDADGLYSSKTDSFTTKTMFDSDNLDTLATGEMTGRVLHSLADMNGDGVGDLVIFSLTGKKVSKKSSVCEVYLGTATPEGATTFDTDANITFQTDDRILVEMVRHDFDDDGQIDVLLKTIGKEYLTNSLWKTMKGFMGDDIKLDLEFYRMDDGRFPTDPTRTFTMGFDGELSHREPGAVALDIVLRGGLHEKRKTQKEWPRAFKRSLFIGDVTGDGHAEVLVANTPDGMGILVGVDDPKLFEEERTYFGVPMPDNGEYNRLVDMNKDGKLDILLHDPFYSRREHYHDKKPLADFVTVLIAR
jgi:hypothetical protein